MAMCLSWRQILSEASEGRLTAAPQQGQASWPHSVSLPNYQGHFYVHCRCSPRGSRSQNICAKEPFRKSAKLHKPSVFPLVPPLVISVDN